MMIRKHKYLYVLFFVALVSFFVACGKGDGGQPNDNNNNGGSNNTDTTIVDDDNPNPPASTNPVQIHQAIFIDPVKVHNKRSDFGIMDSIIYYLKYAPKGSEVHVSIFLLSYQPLIDALKDAAEKGVNVQALIDYSREESLAENQTTISELQTAFTSPSAVTVFTTDISGAINHEKFVIFSKIDLPRGIAKKVVFSTSHNFVVGGTKKVQDAVVMTNEALYNAFLDNWNELASRAKSGMKNYTYEKVNIGDSIEAHFFPRRENGAWDGKDTYTEILDKISDFSTASVRVVMSDWSRVELAEKLTDLQNKGVHVEVITKDKAGNAGSVAELGNLETAGGYVKILNMSEQNAHSKFVLIRGTWDGKENQEIVCTGSHNFTYNALKNNNEVLLVLKNSSLFDDYDNYFDELKAKL